MLVAQNIPVTFRTTSIKSKSFVSAYFIDINVFQISTRFCGGRYAVKFSESFRTEAKHSRAQTEALDTLSSAQKLSAFSSRITVAFTIHFDYNYSWRTIEAPVL